MTTIACVMSFPEAPNAQAPIPIAGAVTEKLPTAGTPRSEASLRPQVGIGAPERHRSIAECELETIRRAQLGDAMAWEALVRQHIGWVLNTCSRWTGSRARAEDLTQDVFVRVFRTLHAYQGERSGFRTWLARITRNLLIDDYRRNRRSPRTLSYDSADEQIRHIIHSVPCRGYDSEARLERQEQRAAVSRALRLLNPELRQAVILRDVKGLTYREVSQKLMTPLGTAKSRVNRGRIELVRLLRQTAALAHRFDPNAAAIA